jgi:hypothetical protein
MEKIEGHVLLLSDGGCFLHSSNWLKQQNDEVFFNGFLETDASE